MIIKKPTKKTLHMLIEALPNYDVQTKDIKQLALQLILDTSDDDIDSAYATKGKLKLETLKLLAELIKNEAEGDAEKELLEILSGED